MNITGTPGNDELFGGRAADSIRGLAGNDTITGGAGNDRIEGGDGDDFINGNTGNDSINGGAGADALVIDPNGGKDVIQGFETGTDKVNLSNFDFTNFGDLDLTQVGKDTLLALPGDQTARFVNIQTTDLMENDFVFAQAILEEVREPVRSEVDLLGV